MTRRVLFAAPAAALAAASSRLPIKKGVLLSMLPKSMSMLDRFKLAVIAGSSRSSARQRKIRARWKRSNVPRKDRACASTP